MEMGQFSAKKWDPPVLSCKAKVWVRETTKPTSEILQKISKQNRGFDTSRWHLDLSFPAKEGHVLVVWMDK